MIDDFAKYQDKLVCEYQKQVSALVCSLSIDVDKVFDGVLKLKLKDHVGNEAEYQGGRYLIDRQPPKLTSISTDYNKDATKFDLSFSATDEGAGLDGNTSF